MATATSNTDYNAHLQRALATMRAQRKRIDELEAERNEPIAIIGMSCRFPGPASDLAGYWSALAGGCALGRLDERFAGTLDGQPPFAGLLPSITDFDPAMFGMTPKEAAALDPQQRLLLELAWEALEHAGLAPTGITAQPAGVFVGLTSVDFRELLDASSCALDAHACTGATNCFAAGRISYVLGLDGPAMVVDTACSSSLVAVHLACQSLRQGESRLALAGGANVIASPLAQQLIATTGALSPTGECRPFDAGANGFVRGEGGGMIVLKRLRDAIADRDPVLAVIAGSAVNQDGRSMNLTSPNLEAQIRLLRAGLRAAGVDPSEVSYVEAHGTGTSLGDPIELEALREVLGYVDGPPCHVGSVKASVGHLEAAAGIAGLIRVVLSLRQRCIPRQANFERLNPHISLDGTRLAIATDVIPWPAGSRRRVAGVSAFGMSGTNAHVVLQELPASPRSVAELERPRHVLTLSARTPEAVSALAERYAAFLASPDAPALADVCFTAGTGRAQLRHRGAIVAGSAAEMSARAASLATGGGPGVFRGTSADRSPPRTSLLFTGQGAQYEGMGRGLYEAIPHVRRTLDRCDEILRPVLDGSLLEAMYSSDGGGRLQTTAYAQPAIFALEYALATLWLSWGVQPIALLGHSVGEYAAACVAGMFSLEDGLRLMAERGRLMEHGTAEGAMASVSCDRRRIEAELAAHPGELALAAVNGPTSVVVSGPRAPLAVLCARLEADGVRCRTLPVTRAFHSPLMAPILADLERAASRITYQPPRISVISNVTGQPLTVGAIGGAYWRSHAASPVLFDDGLRTLLGTGSNTLIEVGPTATLLGLAQQSSDGELAPRLLPSLRKGKDDLDVLLESVAALYVAGTDVRWDRFDDGFDRFRVAIPSYPFQRRRYWMHPTQPGSAAGPALASRALRTEASPGEAALAADAPVVAVGEATDPDALRAELASLAPEPRARRVEEVVLDLTATVLGLARGDLEIDAPLQTMGLDSLIAVQLRSRIDRRFGVALALVGFLESPSVAALARQVLALLSGPERPAAAPSLAPVPVAVVPAPADRHQPFALTDLQHAYLIGRAGTFELGNVSTCFVFEFDIWGLDVARLEWSFGKLIERHDMLRAVVHPEGLQQVLGQVPPYAIEVSDLRLLDSESRERRLLDTRRELSEHGFDTARWPLFRIKVSRLIGRRARVHLLLDALILDGWSTSLLLREWVSIYRSGDAELPPPALTYRDYVTALAAIEATEPYAAALAYWRARLASLPPPPDLPLARAPGAIDKPRFSHRQARLGAALWAQLKQRSFRHGVTLATAICTAYAEVLATWSKSSHFTLNLLTLNRLPLHPEVSSVIGNFSATTLLEVEIQDGLPFAAQAQRVQRQLWSDLEHNLVNGVRVLRELNRAQHSAGRAGMPVVFASMLNVGGRGDTARPSLLHQLAGLGDDFHEVHSSVRTPQVWLDHQVLEDAGELVLNWDAVEDLFPPGMITDMFAAYLERLERLATDETAWATSPETLTPAAQLALRAAVNSTAAPLREALLHQPFLERVAEDPGRVAVISDHRALTYGELDELSDRVAGWLRDHGARPNHLVAITMEKGWEQVVAALAVLKAGAAYVPVDASLPAERVRHLLAHAEVECVLTQRRALARVSLPAGIRQLCVDEAALLPRPCGGLAAPAGPGDLAYVIYTSGSTGLPKGVMIDHRAALNTVLDVNQRFGIGAADRVLALSSLSFDLSVYDVFGMLAAGGALVVPSAADQREPGRWLELIRSAQITVWNSVPALMEMLVDHCVAASVRDLPLRVIMMSGDWIPLGLVTRIPKVVPGAKTFSLGGATEASIWSIFHPIEEIDPAWTSVPYGKPMRNQRFAVLDRAMRPRPMWVAGDLYIAGDGLARGYWRDDDKTAASFVAHPQTGERMYRTGDLGRYRPDGSIEFLGRADLQVKINGYRIELGEIEATLAEQAGVRAAVATAVGERGAKRLVAYVVPEPGAGLSEPCLVAALATKLPAYAVPQQIVVLDALPLSANGKVDRLALPDPGRRAAARRFAAARTETENTLVALWRELLGRDEIGITDDFFELGGQSLLAVRLMGQIRQRYGVSAPLATLFERPTIEQLAQLLDAKAGSGTQRRDALVVLRDRGRRPPLFFVHPVGGDVLCYAELAKALGPEQPFFGLQSVDLAPGATRDDVTISDLAGTYLAVLRERQPKGPYFLGGWSMGGVVAYEIAQRLRSDGAPVALLTLVDVSLNPSGERPVMDDASLLLALGRDLAGLARRPFELDSDEIRGLADPERAAYFLARAQACRVLPDEMDRATLAGHFERFRRNYRAMLAYQAVRYDGRTLFVRARQGGATADMARAWNVLAPRAEVIDVDGDHFGITRRDTASVIAGLIAARMGTPRGEAPVAPSATVEASGAVE